jgi:hypothetical protein
MPLTTGPFMGDGFYANSGSKLEALRIAVALLKEQAQYECYVMCDCDDKAKKALQEMADALSVTPEYLEKM